MTVRDLIKLLEPLDQEKEIMSYDHEYGDVDIITGLVYDDDKETYEIL